MNHIKNIFIRSAAYEDGVVINGRTVKYKNQYALALPVLKIVIWNV